MSTKSTIKIEWQNMNSRGFHLYEECLDTDGPLYLELNGCDFTASSSSEGGLPNLVVTIPRDMAKELGLIQ